MSNIVERLNENIIADAFERKAIADGALCERLIRERKEAADTIKALRAENARIKEEYGPALDTLVLFDQVCADNARLRQAMHDIYEVYAGSEGFKPETCAEAYLQDRIKEMAYIAGKHKRVGGGND